MTVAVATTRIEVCGALRIELEGRRVDPQLPGRKGRQLFACLVLSRDRPMSRDQLIEAIWSESAPENPEAAFSTLLTRTRTALGPGVIHGQRELVLELRESAWIDWEIAHGAMAAAEALLAAGDPRGAAAEAAPGLEIARRPFMPGITAPWIEQRRRELSDLHAGLLEASARASLAIGGHELAAAERSARELIVRERFRESAYALLMQVHVARDNVAEALLVYDVLRGVLREHLGLTPGPATRALAERLLSGAAGQAGGGARPAGTEGPSGRLPGPLAAIGRRPCYGRRAELERLAALRREASEGRRRVVLLTGELGAGKTRLAAEAALQAHAEGFDVLYGRAERDQVTPWQPFLDALNAPFNTHAEPAPRLDPALGPEAAELARMVPALRAGKPTAPESDVEPELRRLRLCAGVSALLAAMTRRRPVLLVLDDLHCASRQTLIMLRHVVRAGEGLRLMVLATARDDELPNPALRALTLDLRREHALAGLPLGGLDEAATADLARSVAPRAATASLWRETGGNPFLAEELASETSGECVPDAVLEAVALRMLDLSDTARTLLAVVASADPAVDLETLAATAGCDVSETGAALDEATRAGLLSAVDEGGTCLAFRQPLLRRAVAALASEGWQLRDPAAVRLTAAR
jgi:DNA-binding SARP family transcriptional activator